MHQKIHMMMFTFLVELADKFWTAWGCTNVYLTMRMLMLIFYDSITINVYFLQFYF